MKYDAALCRSMRRRALGERLCPAGNEPLPFHCRTLMPDVPYYSDFNIFIKKFSPIGGYWEKICAACRIMIG